MRSVSGSRRTPAGGAGSIGRRNPRIPRDAGVARHRGIVMKRGERAPVRAYDAQRPRRDSQPGAGSAMASGKD